MKPKHLLTIFAAMTTMGFMSCSDDDNDINPQDVPDAVTETFAQMYPNARYVEWESVSPYYVAEFDYNMYETDAWFANNGEWAMTATDYNANVYNLPDPMQSAFFDSQYATWDVDDVDYYERQIDTFCTIDIEAPGQQDLTMFIDSYGNILKVVPEYEADILPGTIIEAL